MEVLWAAIVVSDFQYVQRPFGHARDDLPRLHDFKKIPVLLPEPAPHAAQRRYIGRRLREKM